jgi:SPP1 family predicted phage head-tail adaptor
MPLVMRITDFDYRFVLETLSPIDDGSGGHVETWQAVTTLWAKLVPLSGEEAPVGASLRSELTYEAVLRYRGEVRPTMRLKSSDRTLEITAVFEGARPLRWPVCHCREVPPQ